MTGASTEKSLNPMRLRERRLVLSQRFNDDRLAGWTTTTGALAEEVESEYLMTTTTEAFSAEVEGMMLLRI